MTTMEKTAAADDAFERLLAAGAESLAVRKANPNRYWAHTYNGPTEYYWDEVPVSRAEYIAAVGEDLG